MDWIDVILWAAVAACLVAMAALAAHYKHLERQDIERQREINKRFNK